MRASSDAITDNKTERVEIKLKCVTIFFSPSLSLSLCTFFELCNGKKYRRQAGYIENKMKKQ